MVQRILLNPENEDYPDLVLMVVDATNLERNLFLASQIYDLNIPMILVVNMVDVLERDQIELDLVALGHFLIAQLFPSALKRNAALKFCNTP